MKITKHTVLLAAAAVLTVAIVVNTVIAVTKRTDESPIRVTVLSQYELVIPDSRSTRGLSAPVYMVKTSGSGSTVVLLAEESDEALATGEVAEVTLLKDLGLVDSPGRPSYHDLRLYRAKVIRRIKAY